MVLTAGLRSLFDAGRLNSLLVEIRHGEGGQDSKNFVSELSSVYLNYAAKKGFKSEILSSKEGNFLLQFSGSGVWDAFKNEIGKHQVQRCPPTEKGSRRHTSIVAVGVLKLFEFKNQPLKDSDLEVITQCGRGKGGQNQNKVASAVRMKHKPTGIDVFINGRDQNQNKKKALEVLTSRVNSFLYEKENTKYALNRKAQIGDSGRSGKIRTYNFFDNLVHDHILNKKTTLIKEVMKGNLDIILK